LFKYEDKNSISGKYFDYIVFIIHMSIDDATVGIAIKALTGILNNTKDGEKRTLTENEIKNLFN
jgi:hypothetical protein